MTATARREILLTVAAASFGIGLALSLYPLFLQPAPPGQLPGYMTAKGLDARASYRFFLAFVALTVLLPLVLRRFLQSFLEARGWARNTAIASMVASIWIGQITRDALWTLLPVSSVLVTVYALRNVDARFTRRDLILVPALLTLFFALVDIFQSLHVERALIVAALAVFALRLVVALIRRRGTPPAMCFVLAPFGLFLQTHFFARDQRHFGWTPLLLVLATPLVLALLGPGARWRHHLRRLALYVIFPVAAYCYAVAAGLFVAEGKSRVDMFEAAHHVVPAMEMLRGERLYRDVIPTHGLIEDGLFDYLAFLGRPVTIGKVLKSRFTVGHLLSIAVYGLAAAATGSAEIGLVVALIHPIIGIPTGPSRFITPIVTLALLIVAFRNRSSRWWIAAGACAALSGFVSVELGAYSILCITIALFLFRGDRKRAALSAYGGAGALTLIGFLSLAIGGIAGAFISTTVGELLTLGPVYALDPFNPPPALDRWFPEVLAAFVDRPSWLYLTWFGTLIFVAVALSLRKRIPLRRRYVHFEPLLILGIWTIILGISYAQRHHLYFQFAVPTLLATAFLLLRHGGTAARAGAVAGAIVFVTVLEPTAHLAVIGITRNARGPLDPEWVELSELPRARGALFKKGDAEVVRHVQRYIDRNLGMTDTFFDFSNHGLLYFLLNRDMPIRQVEVAFYETTKLQQEVIQTLERSPHVKAALIPKTGFFVDNVPSSVRAPLVWAYLQKHFEPHDEDGDIMIWRRKTATE